MNHPCFGRPRCWGQATLLGSGDQTDQIAGEDGSVTRWAAALSRQIRSNSTSPPLPERSVNCMLLVGEYLLRHAIAAQRLGEGQAHRPPGRSWDDRGGDAEPRLVRGKCLIK
jgi:hypothetical protein